MRPADQRTLNEFDPLRRDLAQKFRQTAEGGHGAPWLEVAEALDRADPLKFADGLAELEYDVKTHKRYNPEGFNEELKLFADHAEKAVRHTLGAARLLRSGRHVPWRVSWEREGAVAETLRERLIESAVIRDLRGLARAARRARHAPGRVGAEFAPHYVDWLGTMWTHTLGLKLRRNSKVFGDYCRTMLQMLADRVDAPRDKITAGLASALSPKKARKSARKGSPRR